MIKVYKYLCGTRLDNEKKGPFLAIKSHFPLTKHFPGGAEK